MYLNQQRPIPRQVIRYQANRLVAMCNAHGIYRPFHHFIYLRYVVESNGLEFSTPISLDDELGPDKVMVRISLANLYPIKDMTFIIRFPDGSSIIWKRDSMDVHYPPLTGLSLLQPIHS